MDLSLSLPIQELRDRASLITAFTEKHAEKLAADRLRQEAARMSHLLVDAAPAEGVGVLQAPEPPLQALQEGDSPNTPALMAAEPTNIAANGNDSCKQSGEEVSTPSLRTVKFDTAVPLGLVDCCLAL